MAEKTRVKISYTVDLDEVPVRISELMTEAAKRLSKQVVAMQNIAKSISEQEGASKNAGEQIDNVRVCLSGIDLQLEDCHNLLASFANAQLQLMSNSMSKQDPAPPPVGAEVAEE